MAPDVLESDIDFVMMSLFARNAPMHPKAIGAAAGKVQREVLYSSRPENRETPK
ncbi:hypothetical protein D9M71_824400 [compost metagenome]